MRIVNVLCFVLWIDIQKTLAMRFFQTSKMIPIALAATTAYI